MARSISDIEIGFIKTMLARGERNVDIQFYFNRQDRPANSGRISQIRQGTYGSEVSPASEEELDEFLRNFQASQIGIAVSSQSVNSSPTTISERAIAKFEQRPDGQWYLRDGETSEQECKEVFEPGRMNPIVKAIAALANNKGGFIFLGVENTEFRVVGLANGSFADTDIARISQKVNTFLTPTPDFAKNIIEVGNTLVGVIYVYKYAEPPIIVNRDGDGLESGNIMYRSPGQSAKISAGDLLILLRERDQANQTKLLKSAQQMANIGLDNSIILDTAAGTLLADDTQISIDRELADQLSFIREGEFEEIEGAPALRLIGDVRAVDNDGAIQKRIETRALNADSVLRAFLNRENVRSPLEYIRVSVDVQRQWLPLFYFVHLSKKSLDEVAESLSKTNAVYSNCKTNALDRISNRRTAFTSATGQSQPVLERIVGADIEQLEIEFADKVIVRALTGLPDQFENFEPVFELLGRLFDRAEGNSNLKGGIFRASARLDELAFKPAIGQISMLSAGEL